MQLKSAPQQVDVLFLFMVTLVLVILSCWGDLIVLLWIFGAAWLVISKESVWHSVVVLIFMVRRDRSLELGGLQRRQFPVAIFCPQTLFAQVLELRFITLALVLFVMVSLLIQLSLTGRRSQSVPRDAIFILCPSFSKDHSHLDPRSDGLASDWKYFSSKTLTFQEVYSRQRLASLGHFLDKKMNFTSQSQAWDKYMQNFQRIYLIPKLVEYSLSFIADTSTRTTWNAWWTLRFQGVGSPEHYSLNIQSAGIFTSMLLGQYANHCCEIADRVQSALDSRWIISVEGINLMEGWGLRVDQVGIRKPSWWPIAPQDCKNIRDHHNAVLIQQGIFFYY